MTDTIEKRACEAAVYVIETGATVRAAARHLGISKSTVHKDLTQRLKQYNYALYLQVREILDENKRERHIRGGMATKRKYQQQNCEMRNAKIIRIPQNTPKNHLKQS